METSEIWNIILGGGLISAVVAIVTLRSTARKAKAEAEKAEADAETVRVDNAEHATRLLVENIVKPLKEELNETRKELDSTRKDMQATKREMARLRKAIGTANSCKHNDDCPVLVGLREFAEEHDNHPRGTLRPGGQHRSRNEAADDGTGSDVGGTADPGHRQPP